MPSSHCRKPTRQPLWGLRSSSCSRHLPTCWGVTTTTSAPSSVRITPTSTPADPAGRVLRVLDRAQHDAARGSRSRDRMVQSRAAVTRARWTGLRRAGYLLIPDLVAHAVAGEHAAGYATATEVAEIGARFGDQDLIAIGVHEQGHALVRQGHFEEGLRLLDEVMVAVTAGELSPIVAGIVYCNTIGFWQSVYELRRAREWTDALTRWCEQQPDMVAHTGVCLVHRAEIMQLQGAWDGRARGGAASRRALRGGSAQRTGLREGLLPTGRGPPASRRAARGRGVVPRGKPAWVRAAAWPGAAAPGGGKARRRGRGDPAGPGRGLERARVRRCFPPTSRSCSPAARSRRRAARAASSRTSRRSPERHAPGDVRAGAGSAGLAEGDSRSGSGGVS